MSEKQKWINAYHEAERELNAVTKQRDELRKDKARLEKAAMLCHNLIKQESARTWPSSAEWMTMAICDAVLGREEVQGE